MQHRQLPLRLQRNVAAAKKRVRLEAAATGLERPLGHMITESDVPDYAELQRHYGH